ncbi:5835_t:CDS:2 [Racocetra persica]|uniref:5835_t:CDS:1 n=1 Tax=Racocetra persica TaxID=160502 RepID=A0ACA9MC88_9GLOM|nr:5835_t:CDS:2 [Racocetra persica]
MKKVLIPLFVHDVDSCCDYQPGHSFRADWCLDLHGFLSREEFDARLKQINYHIQSLVKVELSINIPLSGAIMGFIYFFAKYMIEKNAAERAIALTNLLNELFTQYNQHENPTANWKFWWVHSYERYAMNLEGRAYGNGHLNKLKMKYRGLTFSVKFANLFAENALIILEINDALPDLTKHTVGVNLNSEKSYNNNINNVNYSNQMDNYSNQMDNYSNQMEVIKI